MIVLLLLNQTFCSLLLQSASNASHCPPFLSFFLSLFSPPSFISPLCLVDADDFQLLGHHSVTSASALVINSSLSSPSQIERLIPLHPSTPPPSTLSHTLFSLQPYQTCQSRPGCLNMPLPPPPLACFLTCSLFFSTACFLSNLRSLCLSLLLVLCSIFLHFLAAPLLLLWVYSFTSWEFGHTPSSVPSPLFPAELLSNINGFNQSARGLWDTSSGSPG